MNVAGTFTNPRMLVVLGVVVAALAAFLVARPLLLTSDDSSTPAVTSTAKPSTSKAKAKAAAGRVTTVKLAPGLPQQLANKLRHSKVVVVSLYGSKSPGDRRALVAARAGAKQMRVGFLAVNVFGERNARQLARLIGPASAPAVVVVRRPGKVTFRVDHAVDAKIVAQAARNAFAGAAAKKKVAANAKIKARLKAKRTAPAT